MTIRCYFKLANLISLLSSLYFLKYPYLLEVHHLLHFTILSQQCPYVTLDIVFLSALSHPSMCGLMQCSLLVLFSHSLCHLEFLVFLMVRQQSVRGSLVVVILGMPIACLAALSASSFPLIPVCAGTLHKVICFPQLWTSCSQWPVLNSANLFILPILCPLFFVSLSLMSFQLCRWMLLLVVLHC